MGAVRQRRPFGGSAAAPAGDVGDAAGAIVSIDTHKGHVGVSCANHELEPLGVELTFVDEADLAFAAGLRVGDVVTRINGVPITEHAACIGAINRATGLLMDARW